ncbi:MAG: hypothetical protein ABL951_15680 [Alphaproteobacteria bacterium]
MNLRKFWTNLDDASRQAFFRTAMWIALIVGTVYTLGQSDLIEDYTPLAVKIALPEKIVVPKSNASFNLPVSVRLKNNTDETAQFEVPNPCSIIRWFITSHDGDFIQAPAAETCAQVVMKANLPSGQFSEDDLEIPLDTQRYQAGVKYKLMMRYWGQDGSTDFSVEFE